MRAGRASPEKDAGLTSRRTASPRERTPLRLLANSTVARAAINARPAAARRLLRLKILNIASGTRPETQMRATTADDEVLNVDSGHMLIADILRNRPTEWFEKQGSELKIKWEALKRLVEAEPAPSPASSSPAASSSASSSSSASASSTWQKGPVYEGLLRDFVIRALFEHHKGGGGVEGLLKMLEAREHEEFHRRIAELEKGSSKASGFRRGSVEELSKLVEKESYDQVHVINALGFDVVNDPRAFESVAAVLKKGGLLIITSERTGMTSKATGREPSVDAAGRPVLSDDKLPLTALFEYRPQHSEFAAGVFETHYPKMQTHHTSGPSVFSEKVPFVRLVFAKR